MDITPAAALMLIRIDEEKRIDTKAVARRYRVNPDRLDAGVSELRNRGLIMENHLTSAGCDTLEKIVAARRERLAELTEGWPEASHADLAVVLDRLARELIPPSSRAA